MGPPLDLGRLRMLTPDSSELHPHAPDLHPTSLQLAPHSISNALTVHSASSQVTSSSRSSTPSPPQRVTSPPSSSTVQRLSTTNSSSVPGIRPDPEAVTSRSQSLPANRPSTAENSSRTDLETVSARSLPMHPPVPGPESLPANVPGAAEISSRLDPDNVSVRSLLEHPMGPAKSSSHAASETITARSEALPGNRPSAAENSFGKDLQTVSVRSLPMDSPRPPSESLPVNAPGAAHISSCLVRPKNVSVRSLPEHAAGLAENSSGIADDTNNPAEKPRPDRISSEPHREPSLPPDTVFAGSSHHSPLGRGVADFLANLPPATIRDSGSDGGGSASDSHGSYLTQDNDSEEARDDPDEPGLDLIVNTLETYKFVSGHPHLVAGSTLC